VEQPDEVGQGVAHPGGAQELGRARAPQGAGPAGVASGPIDLAAGR
jgi:hypothetical protein